MVGLDRRPRSSSFIRMGMASGMISHTTVSMLLRGPGPSADTSVRSGVSRAVAPRAPRAAAGGSGRRAAEGVARVHLDGLARHEQRRSDRAVAESLRRHLGAVTPAPAWTGASRYRCGARAAGGAPPVHAAGAALPRPSPPSPLSPSPRRGARLRPAGRARGRRPRHRADPRPAFQAPARGRAGREPPKRASRGSP